jgi:hypothetical protein
MPNNQEAKSNSQKSQAAKKQREQKSLKPQKSQKPEKLEKPQQPRSHTGKQQNQPTKSYQWPFQDPKLAVPTIYKAYFSGLNFREYPHNSYGPKYGTFRYLQFRILKFPYVIYSNCS